MHGDILEERILAEAHKKLKYKKPKNQKTITASMVGSEILQMYLTVQQFDIEQEQKYSIDAALLGTLLHKSLEWLFYGTDIQTETKTEMQLDNGWYVTGTYDARIGNIVYDYKFTKAYTYKKLLGDRMHQYAIQMAVIKYLIWKTEENFITPKIAMFMKDHGSKIKINAEYEEVPVLKIIEPTVMNAQETEELLYQKTNELDHYLNSSAIPPQCTDLWWKKVGGKNIPSKCVNYCNFGDSGNMTCPYRQKNMHQSLNQVLDW